jgi:hypothetical protein
VEQHPHGAELLCRRPCPPRHRAARGRGRHLGHAGGGPSISIPTATDDVLGSEKWSIGPSAVAVAQPSPFVTGGLVRHLWLFAGDDDRADVNQTLIQPFVNYNLEDGWFLVSAPIIMANWEADSEDRWVVPIGGGGGPRVQDRPAADQRHPAGVLQRRAAGLRP